VQLVMHGKAEQLVPGGVELDLVDGVPEAVVGAQDRRVGNCEGSPGGRLPPPPRPPGPPRLPRPRPPPPPPPPPPGPRGVQPRRLVQHLVSRRHDGRVADRRPETRRAPERCAPEPVGCFTRRTLRHSTNAPLGDAAGQPCTQALNAWRHAWKPGFAASRAL